MSGARALEHQSHLFMLDNSEMLTTFLKNGCSLSMGGADPKGAIIWFDNTEMLLDYMVCTEWLWVRAASVAICGAGWMWRRSFQSSYIGDHPIKQISWEESWAF